jgi:hypothetical protein
MKIKTRYTTNIEHAMHGVHELDRNECMSNFPQFAGKETEVDIPPVENNRSFNRCSSLLWKVSGTLNDYVCCHQIELD